LYTQAYVNVYADAYVDVDVYVDVNVDVYLHVYVYVGSKCPIAFAVGASELRQGWNCHTCFWLLGKQSERRAADAAVVELENPKHDLRNIGREKALRILRGSDVNLSSAITSTIRLNERRCPSGVSMVRA